MSEQKADTDKFDHTFKAIHDDEVEWESDDVRGLLTLPEGVQVKVLNYDPVMKRLDMKQRFPKGYVEPRHTHDSWHSILVLEGRMCVAGKDLRPGDYVFGWDIPHGPYEYPDGCEVFIVYMGDASHKSSTKTFGNPKPKKARRAPRSISNSVKRLKSEIRLPDAPAGHSA